MARPQIVVKGHLVDQRTKGELIKVVDGILGTAAANTAEADKDIKDYELSTLSFFGSVVHYLEGGEES